MSGLAWELVGVCIAAVLGVLLGAGATEALLERRRRRSADRAIARLVAEYQEAERERAGCACPVCVAQRRTVS